MMTRIFVSFVRLMERLRPRPHQSVFKRFASTLLFSYRFRPSTLQRQSREKPHGSICPPFLDTGAHSCLFDDVAVFRQHRFLRPHQKTAFSKSIVFKSLHSGERFRMAPFSVIVFVEWMIGVSRANQFRFILKTDQCGRGLNRHEHMPSMDAFLKKTQKHAKAVGWLFTTQWQQKPDLTM